MGDKEPHTLTVIGQFNDGEQIMDKSFTDPSNWHTWVWMG